VVVELEPGEAIDRSLVPGRKANDHPLIVYQRAVQKPSTFIIRESETFQRVVRDLVTVQKQLYLILFWC